MDIFPTKINIVVTDVVNDVTYSRKSDNTHVVITLLLHDVIHWKTATSYEKAGSVMFRHIYQCAISSDIINPVVWIAFYMKKIHFCTATEVKKVQVGNAMIRKRRSQKEVPTQKTEVSSYFPNRWPVSYLNLTKNRKTHIWCKQHKNF